MPESVSSSTPPPVLEPVSGVSGAAVDVVSGAAIDAGACETPDVIEGIIVRHCAYGIPGYGENPRSDAKETPLLLVLDRPLELTVHEYGDVYQCYHNVTMLQVVSNEPMDDGELVQLESNHVRASVEGYFSPLSPHYYTRVSTAVTSVDDVRPVAFRLRSVWATVKHDFIGTSCVGWPR